MVFLFLSEANEIEKKIANNSQNILDSRKTDVQKTVI